MDTRKDGEVCYLVKYRETIDEFDDLLNRVSRFITNQVDQEFVGRWLVGAYWDSVHPFPHGSFEDTSDLSEDYKEYIESVSVYRSAGYSMLMMNYHGAYHCVYHIYSPYILSSGNLGGCDWSY